MKSTGGRGVCHENPRGLEGFHRMCSYDESSSEYADLLTQYNLYRISFSFMLENN